MMGVKIQQTCYSSIFHDLNQCICVNKANGSNEVAMYTMLSTGRLGSNRSTAEWHMTHTGFILNKAVEHMSKLSEQMP